MWQGFGGQRGVLWAYERRPPEAGQHAASGPGGGNPRPPPSFSFCSIRSTFFFYMDVVSRAVPNSPSSCSIGPLWSKHKVYTSPAFNPQAAPIAWHVWTEGEGWVGRSKGWRLSCHKLFSVSITSPLTTHTRGSRLGLNQALLICLSQNTCCFFHSASPLIKWSKTF